MNLLLTRQELCQVGPISSLETLAVVPSSTSYETNPDTLRDVLVKRIHPLIEHVCALRMQHTLVPALTEIEMHEENKDTSFLSKEYAHILDHRDEIANQDLDLSRLIRSVRNLYVNANMFRGRDVQTRSAQLTKMIEDGYDLDRICAFMEVDGGK